MRDPRPFCSPPKYSATIAAITAVDDAIRSPVNRYGSAPGTVTVRVTCHGDAA